MFNDKISIILPCYQAQQHLEIILLDICSQSYTYWELICISNGKGQEQQLHILKEWEEKDNRIKAISTPSEKGGVSYARNIGIEAATGDWICFVDADDRITPEHLSLMVNAIDPDTDVVYGGITSRTINNGVATDTAKPIDDKHITNAILNNDNVSAPYNILVKKSMLKDLRFNKQYTYGEDAVFKLHLLNNAKHVKLIPLTGYIYVRDAGNASAVDRYHETMEEAINEKFELLEDILKKYGMDEEAIRRTVHQMYYDVALVPILTNPFHLGTTLSFGGKYKRVKKNFFEKSFSTGVFMQYNTVKDRNPFCRLLRVGHHIHSCFFVVVVMDIFYLYKYHHKSFHTKI